MKIVKLLATASLAVALLLGLSSRALAEFPEEPITIVVPWPAGGAYDLAARLMAEKPPENLPVSMVVNNVTGAAGSNGVRHVAKSDPDGYTIGMMGTHAIAQSYMNRNATPWKTWSRWCSSVRNRLPWRWPRTPASTTSRTTWRN
ncbi:hypothetical protein ASALC70_00129 [Alcanivorax sp. ALC70]|nr:hypothetical protein ASALC70_00129 [Alcanivorax sp. ALC70]